VLWLNHVLRSAGGAVSVLLKGNAVSYAVRGQDASGLAFGGRKQTQPPRLDADLVALSKKGVAVFFVEEDAAERGIERADLIEGVQPIGRAGLTDLLGRHDLVWHW
jgi:hypothetical protein